MRKFEIEIKKLKKKNYGAYKMIGHAYKQADIEYCLYHVQGDAYASPSRMEIKVPIDELNLPATWLDFQAIPFCDFLHRELFKILAEKSESRGDGNSGQYFSPKPLHQIVARSAVQLVKGQVLLRFGIGLPALGRIIEMDTALEMLTFEVPEIAQQVFREFDRNLFENHLARFKRQEFLRLELEKQNWIAFVENGSTLPRKHLHSQEPLEDAVLFKSPKKWETTIEYQGEKICGMYIPHGLTLIAGGGFHGKSTLLDTLEMGVYNHIESDGRSGVVIRQDAMKIRSEDGRPVHGVDISNWVKDLPGKKSPNFFNADDASGSTSQAAAISEAMEMGSKLFLIDEDLSAVNLLVRDERMRALIPQEPLIPLEDRLSDLDNNGISVIMVVGASARYLDFADQLLVMDAFKPIDKSDALVKITNQIKVPAWKNVEHRKPLGKELQQVFYKNRSKVKVQNTFIQIGGLQSDSARVSLLLCREQQLAVASAIEFICKKHLFNNRNLKELLETLETEFVENGLDAWSSFRQYDLVKPRFFEVGAVWNRLLELRMQK